MLFKYNAGQHQKQSIENMTALIQSNVNKLVCDIKILLFSYDLFSDLTLVNCLILSNKERKIIASLISFF